MEANLKEGVKYYIGEDKKEQGVYVKKVKGILFFKMDEPTRFEIDTEELAEQGRCFKEGIGYAGFPDGAGGVFTEV